MALLLVGGYLLGERMLAKQILSNTTVIRDSIQPRRILSPEEAAKIANDQPSRVWTEGVKESDIPDLAPEPRSRPARRTTPRQPAPTPTPTPAAPDEDGDTPVTSTDTAPDGGAD